MTSGIPPYHQSTPHRFCCCLCLRISCSFMSNTFFVTREWNDEWKYYLKSPVTTFKFLNCKSYQTSKLDKLYLVAMLAKTIVWLSNVNVYWKPLTTNKDGNAPNEKVDMSIRISYTVIGKQKTLCQYSLQQQICLQKTNLYNYVQWYSYHKTINKHNKMKDYFQHSLS